MNGPQGELRSARRQHCPVPCINCSRIQAVSVQAPSVLATWLLPCDWCRRAPSGRWA